MTVEKSLKHVAIIMDGNGRWGQLHRGSRSAGHKVGVENVRTIVRHSGKLGLQALTLWGFSTDNWNRPKWEVNVLMKIFEQYAIREVDELDASNIRVDFIGRIEGLPKSLQRVLEQVRNRTEKNTGPILQIALNYGGTQEIVDATRTILLRNDEVSDESLKKEIFLKAPAPDLIIRTGGEMRTSGFMPLATYAEWSFSKTLWPDFTTDELDSLCSEFQGRERRFGGLVNKKD